MVGLGPPLVLMAVTVSLPPETQEKAPEWFWIPYAFLILAWLFVVPLVIAWRRTGPPSLPPLRVFVVEFLLALAVLPVVLGVWAVVVQTLNANFGEAVQSDHPFEQIAVAPNRIHLAALLVIGIAVAPIAEEVFFRGLFYNLLKRRMPWFLSALIQALVFGFLHPFGFSERVGVAILGLCLAIWYEWRKTLLSPMYVHALGNAVGLVILATAAASWANAPQLGVRSEPVEGGCLITDIAPGSAAEAAGLEVGDVLTGLGDYAVADRRDIVLILRTKQVGEVTPVYFRRDGEDLMVEATLQARPERDDVPPESRSR